ncbi:MAG TPA: cytochrome-c peroxidase [Desulfosarcina sp.]|nr:cytochrome-c peroxidase [Desulfosarcina sp.]
MLMAAESPRLAPRAVRHTACRVAVALGCLLWLVSVPVRPAEPIKPIPAEVPHDPDKAKLGRRLFHEPLLSDDQTLSCASCHDLARGGDDGRRYSVGIDGQQGTINAPTVYNAVFNVAQFWDGRARSLKAQVDGPVQAANEMGSLWPDVVARLYRHPEYPALFDAVYEDGISRENIKDAITHFERTLITPNSRFDRWLAGNENALNSQEVEGYRRFKEYGCTSCHQGRNAGGNMFQKFGVLNSYFTHRGNITEADYGRFNVTGNEADRHVFKVPSLRMAAHTAPYLHDGSAATLREAVDIMFRYQLGRQAPEAHKEAIVAFIRTLAGEMGGLQ